MGAVLLDTTVLIDALRGKAAAQRILGFRESGDDPFVCAINVEEVYRGLNRGEEGAAALLFRGMRLAPLAAEEGRRAGEWRRHFAQRGRTLSQADCLIAAAAMAVGARLVTGNPKDYPMREVSIEHWPVG